MEALTRPGEHVATNPPAAAFSSVMGICGLGRSWRAAAQGLAAPRAIGKWLIALDINHVKGQLFITWVHFHVENNTQLGLTRSA